MTSLQPLYRTFDPKIISYQTNGSGRDTYIKFPNGGFTQSPERHRHVPKRSLMNTTTNWRAQAPRKTSLSV